MADDPLLQPFKLKHLILRNRVLITAHEPAYAEDGMPKERYRAYHVARAKAGVALTMTAGSASVARDSPPVFNNVLAWRDDVVPWMKALADECRAHGAAVMVQLTHLGRRTRWDRGDWLPSVSPSHRRETAHRSVTKKLEDWDVARIVKDYADAAERMQAAGLDGIELEAYGHLIDQFWSPLTNAMDPPYGGSLDNRLRFGFDVLKAIRDRVGPDFIVGVRHVADELLPGGIGRAEGFEIAKRLAASGHVDFLNVIRGHIDSDPGLVGVIPLQGMPSAPHLDFAGEIRAATGLPTFHAARIQDVATARHAIAEGKLDMVGMTRAHLADPLIVAKILSGREAEIRPCVGATFCLDRIYQGGEALCIHNAATGRELTMPHVMPRAAQRRRIVVVGAGPAGLEAARIGAERGHDVLVLEAAAEAGGQVRLAARSPRRRELLGLVDWRLDQCARRGVDMRFGVFAEREQVLLEKPDVVIVATGGLPRLDGIDGVELALSPWDVLSGEVKPTGEIYVFDDAGDFAGLQAAEMLAAQGAHVEVATPDRSFAPEVMGMNLVPYVKALRKAGAVLTVAQRLVAIRRDGNAFVATIGSDYDALRVERRFDRIVCNQGTLPADDLYFALKAHSRNRGEVDYAAWIEGRAQTILADSKATFALFRIGDAVSPRNVHAAIFDALRLVKDL